jgi:hypothetical protein
MSEKMNKSIILCLLIMMIILSLSENKQKFNKNYNVNLKNLYKTDELNKEKIDIILDVLDKEIQDIDKKIKEKSDFSPFPPNPRPCDQNPEYIPINPENKNRYDNDTDIDRLLDLLQQYSKYLNMKKDMEKRNIKNLDIEIEPIENYLENHPEYIPINP